MFSELESRDRQSLRAGSLLIVGSDRSWLAPATAILLGSVRAVSTAETATEAIDVAMRNPPNVVVIAPPLAEGSPLHLVNQLAMLGDQTPLGVVYVADLDRDAGLRGKVMRAGANDWIARVTPISEVATRVAMVVRAFTVECAGERMTRGPLTVDALGGSACVDGALLELTGAEFSVLRGLAVAAGRSLLPVELAKAIGWRSRSQRARIIGAHVESLRVNLGAAAPLLEVSRRHGYRLGWT
jgi:DNA-binding response OmpR family regulator